jgi:hypothetical protein
MNRPIHHAQAEPMGKAFHDAQGVVLQRLDLDGLTMPRRDHPIADFDIQVSCTPASPAASSPSPPILAPNR